MLTAERIVIEGDQARVEGGDGVGLSARLDAFLQRVRQSSVQGFDEQPLPKNNLLWKVEVADVTICILEEDPALRRLEWLDPKSPAPVGPEAKYIPRKLATPYVILKVVFRGGHVLGRVELFYRNSPLRHLDDELYWSNLYNVSPHSYGCTASVCTQYLHKEPLQAGIHSVLQAIANHLWGGGFNKSSDLSEGSSCWTKACQDEVDPRVTDLSKWERESIQDPRFILDIPWKPTGLTVRSLIELELQTQNVLRNLGCAEELVNLLMQGSP